MSNFRLINNNNERSGLELLFKRLMPQWGIDPGDWERDFQFSSDRKWQLDFARLDVKVAIEIDGGTSHHGQSSHTSPAGYKRNMAKRNAAQIAGWIVLAFTPNDFNHPSYILDTINDAIDSRLISETP